MNGWQWFWTLVGFLCFIIFLIFLYFYEPFEQLFVLVVHGLRFDNIIFRAALLIGIVGFCLYHWRAWRTLGAEQGGVEAMVLSSLQGSTFIAVMLSGGAALQAVQSLCVALLRQGAVFGADLGRHIAALVTLLVLTAVFCLIFWLLKTARAARRTRMPH